MKKLRLFTIFLSIGFGSLAQYPQKTESPVVWKPVSVSRSISGESARTLFCEGGVAWDGNPGIPALSLFFPETRISRAILDVAASQWIEVPFWELSALDTSSFLSQQLDSRLEISPGEIRKQEGTWLSFPLIRKSGNRWEKLNRYVLRYDTQKLPQAISNPSPIARITQTESSIFRRGSWIKVGVTQTGVYQILVSDATSLGLDLNGRNPDLVKLYGTNGKMLSEANSAYNFQDIPEMAIQVEDGGDGVLNPNDRILFYAEDPNSWIWNPSSRQFEFRNHLYSDTAYFFLTYSDGRGKRIASIPSEANPEVQVRNYQDRWAYAPEKVNVISAGRTWYADVLDFTTTKDLSFDVRGHDPDSAFQIRLAYMARSGAAYPFRTQANGQTLSPDLVPGTTRLSELYAAYGQEIVGVRTFKPNSPQNNLNININYLKAGNPQSIGYINFVEVNGYRRLAWQNRDFGFRRAFPIGRRVEYVMEGLPANHRIWDVTRMESVTQRLINGGSFTIQQDSIREFFAFNPGTTPRPQFMQRMNNQDVRGLPTPDLLIVTHPRFLEQANRLASFRRSHDNMDVEVVTTTQIYNEFSSGAQDVTAIRNAALHLYHKTPGLKLKYILLFGDCSFDYKNRIPNNTNFVPTYSSPASLPIISTYASDDFYCILPKTKGGWGSNDLMDIGPGRLPAKTEEEARILVDKIIHYSSSPNSLGEWRNRYTFAADNGDDCEHSRQANTLAESYLNQFPASLSRKIFLGAYPRVASAGGFTSPEATNDLINTINKGSLFVNYTGHGGETVWADEFLFSSDMLPNLTNYDRLSFFITATCDFGRHDYPSQTSGAESLLLLNQGGAVGVVTTGRPVGSINNFVINQAFWNFVLKPVQDKPGRMGDALREAKNNNTFRASNRGFTLLGDPSNAFAFPRQEIKITNLAELDTIRGLDLVEIEGEVQKNGAIDPAFNGKVFATFFDRPGILTMMEACTNREYPVQRSFLYNGSAQVTNGTFRIRFMVPRDISFLVGKGRLSLYAQDPTRMVDAFGAQTDLVVGGENPNPPEDNEGPEVRLFMNDETFVNGGLVDSKATLLAYLEDENGINVSGLGLGHDLTATLDGEQVFVLNEFFENEENSYQKGKVEYPFRDLALGMHTLTVKGWDNLNNSGEATILFEVGISNQQKKIVKNLVLFPNPTRDKIYIQMDNAFAGEELQVELTVFDLLGQKISENYWGYDRSTARLGSGKELAWDGKKSDGSLLPGGTYLCKIRVKSDANDAEYTINQKIVLIR